MYISKGIDTTSEIRYPVIMEKEVVTKETLGPAMYGITPMQRKFVLAYMSQGGVNPWEAVRDAGYKGTVESWRDIAAGLLRDKKILDAFREMADRRLQSGAVLASSVLLEVAGNPLHKDQYKAAVEILDRSGLVVEEVKRVIVEDHRSVEDIERRITQLATRLGLDPKALLPSNVADAAFTVVDDELEGMLR